jgi:tetratricopeptide (TPR) repeat protein
LLIISAIIIKKLPALAILDVDNMAKEKEAKFKNLIIKKRIDRDIARVSGIFGGFFIKLNSYFNKLTEKAIDNLKKIKLKQKVLDKVPHQQKEKILKSLVLESEKLSKAEEYSETEKKLVEVISLDQKNLLAFYNLGEVYEKLRKYPEARQTYGYALKLSKQELKDDVEDIYISPQEVYFSLAGLEKKAGNIEAAYENISEALEIEANNPRFLDLIVDLSIIKKDKNSAWQYLEKLSEVNPENNKLADRKEQIEKIDSIEEEVNEE